MIIFWHIQADANSFLRLAFYLEYVNGFKIVRIKQHLYSISGKLGVMKQLNGLELASYIKERQAKQVRNLRQSYRVFPKLAIIQTIDDPVIDTYVRAKKRYGDDILVEVELHLVSEDEAVQKIKQLNNDNATHGIIVQLPLNDKSRTDELLDLVDPSKDVDALGKNAVYDPATPMAINWLLAGCAVELSHKKITLVGQGRLVGAPLAKMWQNSGYDVTVVDSSVRDLAKILKQSDVIVTATGVPGLISSDMIKDGAAVIDAATASEDGKIVGDLEPAVRERGDILVTPEKGGVGPLTVSALFDNVIRAARAVATRDQASS